MSHRFLRNSFALVCLIACTSAFAQNDGSIPILQKGLTDALDQVFTKLQNVAVTWLGVFMLLQFVWTNWQLILNDADLPKVFAKFASGIFWFVICIYIFNNGSGFIKDVTSYIMATATGATGSMFDPIRPIQAGISVATQLLATLDSTQSILQSLNPFPSIMMGIVSVVILAISALLAFKILMVFIETKMVIALSPLSFALLGLNAFRDQGMAPFKYIVSMGLRMFLYGAVLAALEIFSTSILAAFKALPGMSDPSVWPPIWSAAIGYLLLGAVALRVDSIAVMLASGSSQMSTGDAAAVGAAAGAAAGLAGAATMGGLRAAAKPMQSMADFMKGGAGAVANASQKGAGAGASTELSKPPLASTGSSNAGQGQGSEFQTNKFGVPERPQPSPDSGSGSQGGNTQKENGGTLKEQVQGDAARTEKAMNHGDNPIHAVDKRSRSTDGDSGEKASIGAPGNSDSRRSDDSASGKPTPEKKETNIPRARDHLANLNRSIIENANPVHIQMNTHQGD